MVRDCRRLALALLVGFTCGLPGLADEELELEHSLALRTATPHTAWARPYALGKLRVLFITGDTDGRPRECAELMQRFDLEGQAVYWARIVDTPDTGWHGGDAGLERLAGLLAQKWDCFVLLEVGLGALSAELQHHLLSQVTEGAGIVYMGLDDPRVLKEANRLPELPLFLDTENMEAAYTVARGRGVRMTQRPLIEYYAGWQAEFDHWQERWGRAVLWAAGKEPRTRLDIALQTGRPNTLTIQPAGTPTGQNLRLDLRVTREGEQSLHLADQPVTLGTTTSVPLPHLPAGMYFADARLLSGAGVETWSAFEFRVRSRRTVDPIKLDRNWGEVGEEIAGTVTLGGQALPNERLRVRLLDRRRREIWRQDLSGSTPAHFRCKLTEWMPMLATLEVVLYSGDREFARSSVLVHVTRRHHGRFNFVMWDVPSGSTAPYGQEALARTGVTVELNSGPPPLSAAAYDMAWVPYTTRITPHDIPDPAMKGYSMPFCWNDEATVSATTSKLAEAYRPAREHGVFVWSLGDETTTQGACTGPHDLPAYRGYLKQEYGTLDALNRSWGTQLTEWGQITLNPPAPEITAADWQQYIQSAYGAWNPIAYIWFISFKTFGDFPLDQEWYQREEAHSWHTRNYPRWYDRQAFKSWNFAQLCEKYGEAFRKNDPQARTGVEGAGRFRYGDDADLIIRKTGFWSPYPDTMDEVVRSLAPRDYPRGNWMGYRKDADSLLYQYWRMVTRGMDGVWFWRVNGIGTFHGWLMPTYEPYPAIEEVVRDTQVMRDGLGDLLLRSEMQDDGIAVLYSHPSFWAQRLENGGGYGEIEADHKATHSLVRELGLQFRYVSDRMLRLGEFDQKRFRVLLLPRADAIGDKEAAVIEAFVRNGGTVIADVRPGVFDGHCKLRAQGALDGLFGIKRTGLPAGQVAAVELSAPVLSLPRVTADPGVQLAGGKARGMAGEVPVLIENQVGKGRAILLNFPFVNYPSLASDGTPAAAAELIGALLARAGVEPWLKLQTPDGQRLRQVETIRWRNGRMQIVALFRHEGQDGKGELLLPQAMNVFDLRARQPLGRTQRFPVGILSRRATFFALCPGALPAPKLQLDRPTVTRGQVARGTITVPRATGLHAFRVRVNSPRGPQEWHDQVILAGAQPAGFSLPVAWNDPPGTLQVSALELFSEKPTRASLNVR